MVENRTSICWQGSGYLRAWDKWGISLCRGKPQYKLWKTTCLSCNLKWIVTGSMFSPCTTTQHIILCHHRSDNLHSATRSFHVVYIGRMYCWWLCANSWGKKKTKADQDFLDFLVCGWRKLFLDGKRHQNGSCKGFLKCCLNARWVICVSSTFFFSLFPFLTSWSFRTMVCF